LLLSASHGGRPSPRSISVDGEVCAPCPVPFSGNHRTFPDGFKFRQSISTEAITESLRLVLEDFYEKKTRNSHNGDFIERLYQWKEKVFIRCKENLKKYMKDNPHPFKAPFKMCSAIKRP
jgi:hypothetical protein